MSLHCCSDICPALWLTRGSRCHYTAVETSAQLFDGRGSRPEGLDVTTSLHCCSDICPALACMTRWSRSLPWRNSWSSSCTWQHTSSYIACACISSCCMFFALRSFLILESRFQLPCLISEEEEGWIDDFYQVLEVVDGCMGVYILFAILLYTLSAAMNVWPVSRYFIVILLSSEHCVVHNAYQCWEK